MTKLMIVLCLFSLTPPMIISQMESQKFKECGLNSKIAVSLRIVGGRPSNPKDWPWMAAIALKPLKSRPFCGGALISDRHILTAAHCVERHTVNDIRVRLGETNFDAADESSSEDFDVEQIRKHDWYNPTTFENDIAILKLKRQAIFSQFILPVCLPPPNQNFEDKPGFVTGWGARSFGGKPNSVLHEVLIKVWKQSECVTAFSKSIVTANMMCCGWTSGEGDSCQGDSGGPFMVQLSPANRWHVAGIVSWGQLCGVPDHPGVYTRVNYFLDWININTQFEIPQKIVEVPQKIVEVISSKRPFDCSEVCFDNRNCKSGVYQIFPTGHRAVEVFCDMVTRGGGWTVLLLKDKGKKPQENFQRGLADYKNGFGQASKEYWIGTEIVYKMTNTRNYTLRIDAKSNEYDDAWGEFTTFRLLPEHLNYRILFEGSLTGNLNYDGNGGLSLSNSRPAEGASFFHRDATGIHGTFYPADESAAKWTVNNPLGSYVDVLVMMMRLRRDL